jgi:hypothetical protein
MRLESIANGTSRFVALTEAKIQVHKAFLFPDSVNDFENLSLTDIKVLGKG